MNDHTGNKRSTTVPASVSALSELTAFASSYARDLNLPPELVANLQLIVEELFLNIANHGYEGDGGEVEVELSHRVPGELTLTFIDSGIPFDPTKYEASIVQGDPSALQIGGLGIHFVRKLATRIRYKHLSGKNILTVVLSG